MSEEQARSYLVPSATATFKITISIASTTVYLPMKVRAEYVSIILINSLLTSNSLTTFNTLKLEHYRWI